MKKSVTSVLFEASSLHCYKALGQSTVNSLYRLHSMHHLQQQAVSLPKHSFSLPLPLFLHTLPFYVFSLPARPPLFLLISILDILLSVYLLSGSSTAVFPGIVHIISASLPSIITFCFYSVQVFCFLKQWLPTQRQLPPSCSLQQAAIKQ